MLQLDEERHFEFKVILKLKRSGTFTGNSMRLPFVRLALCTRCKLNKEVKGVASRAGSSSSMNSIIW